MGRYSPTVLPTPSTPFTSFFNDAADAYINEKRRKRADEMGDLEYYIKGGRRGQPPKDDEPAAAREAPELSMDDLPGPRSPALPPIPGTGGVKVPAFAPPELGAGAPDKPDDIFAQYDRHADAYANKDDAGLPQRGDYSATSAGAKTYQGDVDQFWGDLSRDLKRPAPGTTGNQGNTAPGDGNIPLDQLPQSDLVQRGDPRAQPASMTHPGAFDPATGEFSGGRSRYVTIDKGHYLDLSQTPAGIAQQNRLTNTELAGAIRGQNELQLQGARGRDAIALEDERQKGRKGIQDRIDARTINSILLRAQEAGKNQQAHDARSGAGRQSSAQFLSANNAAESHRMQAAMGLISAANGDRDAALDYLQNTPDGQAMMQNGLKPYHLTVAAGLWRKDMTQRSLPAERGVMAETPAEVGQDVQRTGRSVAPPALPPKKPAATPASTKKKISQQGYDNAIAGGYSHDEIAAAYDVTGLKIKP